jgi:hypothetical protein
MVATLKLSLVRHLIFTILFLLTASQVTQARPFSSRDTTASLDLVDLAKSIGKGGIIKRTDAASSTSLHISIVPAAGYTLQTGLAALLSGNATYHAASTANESVITSSIAYTQYHQVIFPIISETWTANNTYHISTDWRYLKYPSLSYGLGSRTSIENGFTLDYSAIRLHQTVLRHLTHGIYAGIGWDFDYFWNISELDTPAGIIRTAFERSGARSIESANGPVLAALYDTRRNPINATGGILLKVDYHLHPKSLGNATSWNSLVIDLRKYVTFPASSNNVLALWSYNWFTTGGQPPYLLLPNTGGDPSSNTGRGYIQGRYRGANFVYLEGEYRMQLTRNGLLGAVVFANAESVTRNTIRKIDVIAPGYGAGLRIKLNKFSNTNLGIDYGFGTGGSKGLSVNLGEVF